jgi:hypothetical protein
MTQEFPTGWIPQGKIQELFRLGGWGVLSGRNTRRERLMLMSYPSIFLMILQPSLMREEINTFDFAEKGCSFVNDGN